MNLQQLTEIEEIRAVLAYHQVLGIDGYPREAGLLRCMDVLASPLPREKMSAQPHRGPGVPDSVAETLADIGLEVQGCGNCELGAKRLMPVAGGGSPKARLLIVGHWLSLPDGQSPASADLIFGLEEDQMVARMLAAIHLDPQDVFVTNVLKCAFPASIEPAAVHIQCCLAYLRRQIAVMAPELICTMGIIATRALLDLPQSLSQLRGRFHLYPAGGRQIPVMPTYHPSYLMKVDEMKRETWSDLQLIEKKLAR
jgi:uracil-DNA glycosylase